MARHFSAGLEERAQHLAHQLAELLQLVGLLVLDLARSHEGSRLEKAGLHLGLAIDVIHVFVSNWEKVKKTSLYREKTKEGFVVFL